ncbi:4Fe-4S binding protein [Oscillospiraceae bacterium MB08-C2-2]|nr:4Fe-4S binding protein [Oscillospiraceae bacterium MB08-C2-2]
MFTKGTVLLQHKEPALSRPIIRFVNPQTDALRLEERPAADPDHITGEEIIQAARLAQIVDERDGKPLFRKLMKAIRNKAEIIIVDAVDDEPYVSSQLGPLLKCSDEVLSGLQLCQKAVGSTESIIAVYKMLTDLEVRIPAFIGPVPVLRLRGGYPAEPRYVKLSGLAQQRKLLVGSCALIHLHRAVHQAKRQTSVFVTVAGNCVANAANYEVSIGMTVTQLLERVGLVGQPSRIVCGGPMTGVAVIDCDRTTITSSTRAILAFAENSRDGHYRCIGCGRCEQVCPAGLNPMYIYKFVEHSYYRDLETFDPDLCIGCGTCSYICPSKLDVSLAVEKAGRLVKSSRMTTEEEVEGFED